MYRFSLAGKKKHTCPNCQKRTFVRYIDNETNQYLPDHYGKCERIHNCGYELNPYKDGYHKGQGGKFIPSAPVHREPSFIPDSIVRSYGRGGDYFSQFLINRFGDKAKEALKAYQVGTADHYRYERGTIFWQVDSDGKVRAGKVMVYNPDTGKRIKDRQNWIHTLDPDLKGKPFELAQVLFGTHLLALPENKGKTVCIVESEKTALIASLHFPQYLWLATGGLSNLKAETVKPLAGRKVILVPDTSLPNKQGFTAFDLWSNKANHIRLTSKVDITVTDALERIATDTERDAGYDLADYLLNCPERVEGLFNAITCIPISEIQHPKRINIPAIKAVDNAGADFLSKDPEFWQAFDTYREFILQSPCGSGKTETAEIACKRDKKPTFVPCPTAEIARQQSASHNGNLCIGGEKWFPSQLIEAGLSGEVFYCTYEFFVGILASEILDDLYDGFYVFIDEAHELENQDNIRSKTIDTIVNFCHPNCRKKVYMTGTVSLTLAKSLGDLPIYRSKIQSKVKLDFNIYTYDSKKANAIESTASRILHMKSETPNNVIQCRINSIKKAHELADRCRGAGQQVAVLHSTCNTELDEFSKSVMESIRETGLIPEGVDIVICTSVLDTGVNIRNTNVRAVAVHNGHVGYEVYNIYQFFSRFRAVDTLDVSYIISDHALKTEKGKGLDELIRAVQDSYTAKVNQYQLEASTLKGSSVSELFARNADLINLKPRYRHDGTNWQARTTHVGRECLTEFARGLTTETALTYMQSEYNCIVKAELKAVTQQTTYFDSSAKDKEALEAVAIISQWLKDSTYRRYLYTYAIQNGEHDLAKQIAKFEPAYSWNYAKDNIIPTVEYQEFIQKNKHTLAVGCYKARVKQFVGYMVHVNHVELSAGWVQEYSDTTKANAQRARVSLATHLFINSDTTLREAYNRDGRNEFEREIMQVILTIAGEFTGKEMECQALWSAVRSKFKDADQYDISEKRICAIIKAGYQHTIKKTKDLYFITLERRTELADVVGTELVSSVKESIRMMVQGVGENVYKDFPQPVIPPEKAPEPVLIPEIVPNPGAITADTPTPSGYYAEFWVNGQVETRWIDLSVFDS